MNPADPLPALTTPQRGTPPRTAVVALGSIVMGDDGAGAAVLAELEAGWELPEALDRIDLGTPGPYFAEYVRGYENLVVIDALRSPGAPGSIRTFNESNLARVPAGSRLTADAERLIAVYQMAEARHAAFMLKLGDELSTTPSAS